MRYGHVAMVSRVLSDREVLLTHANWSHPGKIERDVRAVDVSPEGDWSQVKVWYAPTGDLGTSTYAAKGFIYANAPHGGAYDDNVAAPIPSEEDAVAPIQLASADTLALKQFLALK
jgi:hypothetical protein